MLRALLLLVLATVTSGAAAWAQPLPADLAVVEVLPGWGEQGRRVAGLRITLAPGWKTYWRAPGEAGIAPVLDISGSDNLRSAAFVWPVPEVFSVSGMRSIGYPGGVVLPLVLTPVDPAAPIRLRAELDMGVCRDVCVPYSASVAAELPSAATPTGARDADIAAALANRPLSAAEARVRAVACSVEPIADGLRVTARVELPVQGRAEVLVIEPHEPGIWVSDSQGARNGDVLSASADLVPPNARPFALDRSRLRLTVLGDGRAVEIRGCPAG